MACGSAWVRRTGNETHLHRICGSGWEKRFEAITMSTVLRVRVISRCETVLGRQRRDSLVDLSASRAISRRCVCFLPELRAHTRRLLSTTMHGDDLGADGLAEWSACARQMPRRAGFPGDCRDLRSALDRDVMFTKCAVERKWRGAIPRGDFRRERRESHSPPTARGDTFRILHFAVV